MAEDTTITVMYDQISEKNICKFMATNLTDSIAIPCSDAVQDDILNHATQETDSSKWFSITYRKNNGALKLISYDMAISATFDDHDKENARCTFSSNNRIVAMSCSQDVAAYGEGMMEVFYSTDANSGERTMLAYRKTFYGWYLPGASKESCTFYDERRLIELPCDDNIRNDIKDNPDKQIKITYWYDDREKTKGIAQYSFENTDIRLAQAVLDAVDTDASILIFSIDGMREEIIYEPEYFGEGELPELIGKPMYILYYFEANGAVLYSYSLK
jgi:hypothetical protein